MASSLIFGLNFVLVVGYVFLFEQCNGYNDHKRRSSNPYFSSVNSRRTSDSSSAIRNNLQQSFSYRSETSSESNTETIKHCISTVRQSGKYRVHGNAQRSWKHVPHCDLFLIAPPMHRIRLVFRTVNVDCDTSGVLIQDGWTTLPNNRGQRDILPYDDGDANDNSSNNNHHRRKLYLCSKNAAIFKTLTFSQNYGQISYKIQKSESLTFDVEFISSDDVCDDVITAGQNIGTYILRTNRPRKCRVYISGSARLKLLDFRLDTGAASDSTCGTNGGTFLSLQVNSTSWKQLPIRRRLVQCKTDFSDVIIPCQYNVLELHSTQDKLQYAKFTLEELSDTIKEPWSALCY